MSVEQVTPLLIAERRCTNLEACDEAILHDDEKELLALWYDRKHLLAQLAAERAVKAELAGALENLKNRAVKDAEIYAQDGNEPIWAFIADATDALSAARAQEEGSK